MKEGLEELLEEEKGVKKINIILSPSMLD